MALRTARLNWKTLAPWIVPAILLLVWEIVGRMGLVSPTILSSPGAVFRAGLSSAAAGELSRHLLVSAGRAMIGFVVGGSIGLVLGLGAGLFRSFQLLVDGPMQMVRAIPLLALVPVVIIWFGIGEQAKLFLIALAVMFPVYLNTFYGVRAVDPQLVEMGKSYGLRGFALYREVLLPGALPAVLVGVRHGLGLMWLTLVVAETIAAEEGLGYMAMNAREFMQMDVVLLTILIYALLGKVSDSMAKLLERWLLPWQSPAQRLDIA